MGSIPLEVPARHEMDPVGATASSAQLRSPFPRIPFRIDSGSRRT